MILKSLSRFKTWHSNRIGGPNPSYGFRKLFAYLRRSGKLWNGSPSDHKRVHRIYQALKLNKRRKGKRRLPDRVKQPLIQPEQVNEVWSGPPQRCRLYADAARSDSMISNRKFRTAPAGRNSHRKILRSGVRRKGLKPGTYSPVSQLKTAILNRTGEPGFNRLYREAVLATVARTPICSSIWIRRPPLRSGN